MGNQVVTKQYNSLPDHVISLIAEKNTDVDNAMLMNKLNMIIAKTPKIAQMPAPVIAEAMLKAMIPDPTLQDHDDIYFVPYGNKIEVSFSHNYLQKLAYRNGAVKMIDAVIFREKDYLELSQDGVKYSINPLLSEDQRGSFIGIMVEVKLANNEIKRGFVNVEHIEKARKASKSGNNGPWKTWYFEMAKKVALKNTLKGIDISREFADAIRIDNEDTDFSRLKEVVEEPKAAESLADKMKLGSKNASDVENYLLENNVSFEIKDKWVIVNQIESDMEAMTTLRELPHRPNPSDEAFIGILMEDIIKIL